MQFIQFEMWFSTITHTHIMHSVPSMICVVFVLLLKDFIICGHIHSMVHMNMLNWIVVFTCVFFFILLFLQRFNRVINKNKNDFSVFVVNVNYWPVCIDIQKSSVLYQTLRQCMTTNQMRPPVGSTPLQSIETQFYKIERK